MWYQIEVTGPKSYKVHFKTWHPKFWWAAYVMFRDAKIGRWHSVYLAVRLVVSIVRKGS